jgi:hypothetical protein
LSIGQARAFATAARSRDSMAPVVSFLGCRRFPIAHIRAACGSVRLAAVIGAFNGIYVYHVNKIQSYRVVVVVRVGCILTVPFQAENDALMALDTLKAAFNADVAPILGMARHRSGGGIDPLGLYRWSAYRKHKQNERPAVARQSAGIV